MPFKGLQKSNSKRRLPLQPKAEGIKILKVSEKNFFFIFDLLAPFNSSCFRRRRRSTFSQLSKFFFFFLSIFMSFVYMSIHSSIFHPFCPSLTLQKTLFLHATLYIYTLYIYTLIIYLSFWYPTPTLFHTIYLCLVSPFSSNETSIQSFSLIHIPVSTASDFPLVWPFVSTSVPL